MTDTPRNDKKGGESPPTAEQLATLARSSDHPPGPPTREDGGENESDGLLDLRALVSSSTPSLAAAAERRDARSDSKVDLKAVGDAGRVSEEPARSAPPPPGDAVPALAAEDSADGAPAATAATPHHHHSTPPPLPGVRVRRARGRGFGVGMILGTVLALSIVGAMVWRVGLRPPPETGARQSDGSSSSSGSGEQERTGLIALDPVELPIAAPGPEPGPNEVAPGRSGAAPVPRADAAAASEALAPGTQNPVQSLEGESASATPASAVRDAGAARTRPTGAVDPAGARSSREAALSPATVSTPLATTSSPTPTKQLDAVLSQALGGSSGPAAGPAAAPAGSGPVPATPSQTDVRRVLGALMPQIRQCAGDQVGLAPARIIVRNDGSVVSVSVGGAPFGGTPQGACMEGVVRRARFPRFQQTTFSINFPFSIQPVPQ